MLKNIKFNPAMKMDIIFDGQNNMDARIVNCLRSENVNTLNDLKEYFKNNKIEDINGVYKLLFIPNFGKRALNVFHEKMHTILPELFKARPYDFVSSHYFEKEKLKISESMSNIKREFNEIEKRIYDRMNEIQQMIIKHSVGIDNVYQVFINNLKDKVKKCASS